MLMKRPEQKLLDFLKEHDLSIAFAESMTCGMAMRMGNVSGTSEVFTGSIVCYDTSVKTGLLKIPARMIKKFTPESQQVTDKLAQHLTKKMRTDISAAITGLAAPGGSESKQKPVGTVFISVYVKGKLYREKKKFNGSPLEIKQKACSAMFISTLNVLRKKYRK
jgi:nicotinamide-nucleotide amidase